MFDRDELAGGAAPFELGPDRADGHLAHGPPEGIAQQRPFIDHGLTLDVSLLRET